MSSWDQNFKINIAVQLKFWGDLLCLFSFFNMSFLLFFIPDIIINSFSVPMQNLEGSGRGTSFPFSVPSHMNSRCAHCSEMAGTAEAYTQD